jgi:hypothetical protein
MFIEDEESITAAPKQKRREDLPHVATPAVFSAQSSLNYDFQATMTPSSTNLSKTVSLAITTIVLSNVLRTSYPDDFSEQGVSTTEIYTRVSALRKRQVMSASTLAST